MDYRKPSKLKANENYLRSIGLSKELNPYQDELIEQKKLFLIVCEGENTEPGYFDGFPVPSKTLVIEGGCGSKTSLVDFAMKLREQEKYSEREIWCVFDFDIKPDEAATQPEDFNSAICKAEANGMKVAWSNDAFELWFLLHYQSLETRLSRKEINPILKDHWKLESFNKQAKAKEFCQEHYDRHGGTGSSLQLAAIKRARELHKSYGDRKDYANQCPCTTVYLLVEELNKNIKA